MSGWIDIETDHIAQLVNKLGIGGKLEVLDPMRLQPMRTPDALNRAGADGTALAIIAAVQCVVSAGGSVSVSATTRSATLAPSGGTREGRVLSRSRPSNPCVMKRSCQRQTQVFDLAVWRMISLVPSPAAETARSRPATHAFAARCGS